MGSSLKSQKSNAVGGKKTIHKSSVAANILSSMSASSNWLPHTPQINLVDGDTLALTYLEWLTINAPTGSEIVAAIHEEYAKLLMENIPNIRLNDMIS